MTKHNLRHGLYTAQIRTHIDFFSIHYNQTIPANIHHMPSTENRAQQIQILQEKLCSILVKETAHQNTVPHRPNPLKTKLLEDAKAELEKLRKQPGMMNINETLIRIEGEVKERAIQERVIVQTTDAVECRDELTKLDDQLSQITDNLREQIKLTEQINTTNKSPTEPQFTNPMQSKKKNPEVYALKQPPPAVPLGKRNNSLSSYNQLQEPQLHHDAVPSDSTTPSLPNNQNNNESRIAELELELREQTRLHNEKMQKDADSYEQAKGIQEERLTKSRTELENAIKQTVSVQTTTLEATAQHSSKMSQLRQKLKDQEITAAKLQTSTQDAKLKLEHEYNNQRSLLEGQIQQLTNSLAGSSANVSDAIAQIADLQEKLNEHFADQQEEKQKSAALAAGYKKELEKKYNAIAELRSKLAQTNTELGTAQTNNATSEAEREQLSNTKDLLTKQINELNAAKESFETQHKAIAAVQRARGNIRTTKLEEEIKILQDKIISVQNAKNKTDSAHQTEINDMLSHKLTLETNIAEQTKTLAQNEKNRVERATKQAESDTRLELLDREHSLKLQEIDRLKETNSIKAAIIVQKEIKQRLLMKQKGTEHVLATKKLEADIANMAADLDRERTEHENKKESLAAAIKQKDELEEAKTSIIKSNKIANELHNKNATSCRDKVAELERQIQTLTGQIETQILSHHEKEKHSHSEIDTLTRGHDELLSACEERLTQLRQATDDTNTAQTVAHKAELRVLIERLSSLQTDNTSKEESNARCTRQLEAVRAELAETKAAAEAAEQRRQEFQQQAEAATNELRRLQENMETKKQELETITKKLDCSAIYKNLVKISAFCKRSDDQIAKITASIAANEYSQLNKERINPIDIPKEIPYEIKTLFEQAHTAYTDHMEHLRFNKLPEESKSELYCTDEFERISNYWDTNISNIRACERQLANSFEDISGAVRVIIKIRKETGPQTTFTVTEDKHITIKCMRGEWLAALGLDWRADTDAVENAFLAYANNYNPERNHTPAAANLLKQATVAYENLINFGGNTYGKFSGVFNESTNKDVYSDDSQGLHNSFKQLEEGYSIVLFGYGLSGAGKTYTLLGGGTGHLREEGVLQLGLNDLKLKIHKIEIINIFEEYIDTFLGNKYNQLRGKIIDLHSNPSTRQKLFREYTPDSETVRSNSNMKYDDFNINDIEKLIKNITEHRTAKGRVRATPNNPESSRSHLYIIFRITFTNQQQGHLTLIDTAGRESPTEIYNQYINKTLIINGINKPPPPLMSFLTDDDTWISQPIKSKESTKKFIKAEHSKEGYDSDKIRTILQQGIYINETINHLTYFLQNKQNTERANQNVVFMDHTLEHSGYSYNPYDKSYPVTQFLVNPNKQKTATQWQSYITAPNKNLIGEKTLTLVDDKAAFIKHNKNYPTCHTIQIFKYLDSLGAIDKPTKFILLLCVRKGSERCQSSEDTLKFGNEVRST